MAEGGTQLQTRAVASDLGLDTKTNVEDDLLEEAMTLFKERLTPDQKATLEDHSSKERKRFLDLLTAKDKCTNDVPDDVHKFSNDQFPGYLDDNVFFIKNNCLIQRSQLSGLCYIHAPTIVQNYAIVHTTKKQDFSVLDIAQYIQLYFEPIELEAHVFKNAGGSSKTMLENILQPESKIVLSSWDECVHHFNKYGPGLVSQFEVYPSFINGPSVVHHGKIKGEQREGHHSMVMVGWRKDDNDNTYLLLQNWWKKKQFVEVDRKYFKSCNTQIYFVKTPQHEIPENFPKRVGVYHELTECIDHQEGYDPETVVN